MFPSLKTIPAILRNADATLKSGHVFIVINIHVFKMTKKKIEIKKRKRSNAREINRKDKPE